jgi:hypothetical protein
MPRPHEPEHAFERQDDTQKVPGLVCALEPPECRVVVAECLLHERDGARREPAALAALDELIADATRRIEVAR